MTARTFYKVCDGFEYEYRGFGYGPDYVPDFMALDDRGFGDYVYLTISGDGSIRNWSKGKFGSCHAEIVSRRK